MALASRWRDTQGLSFPSEAKDGALIQVISGAAGGTLGDSLSTSRSVHVEPTCGGDEHLVFSGEAVGWVSAPPGSYAGASPPRGRSQGVGVRSGGEQGPRDGMSVLMKELPGSPLVPAFL